MKIIIVVALLAIIGSLFNGLYFIMRDRSGSNRALYALAARVVLSLALFLGLMVAYSLGWITPTGIPLQPTQ